MSEWKPIESAPRDGTKIDLWVRRKRIPDAFWVENDDGTGWAVEESDWHTGEAYHEFIDGRPSHFTPLPEPPSDDKPNP